MNRDELRVFFDSEGFANQVYGGISRYFAEIVRRLPRYGVSPLMAAPATFNQYVKSGRMPGFHGVRLPDAWRNRYTHSAVRRATSLADHVASRIWGFDVLQRTFYRRKVKATVPSVTTVVDMIPELFPEYFGYGNPHAGKRECCEQASAVVVISECTKRDLVAAYPDLAMTIDVVYPAVDVEFFRRRARDDDQGSILFVGSRAGYKDFSTFAIASAVLLAENPGLHVLCVGGGPLQGSELDPYVRRGVASRVFHRAVTDDELPAIYGGARAFVFPSRYEGFGIPILEAFACRCPTILSRASCFPEVAAEAAEYFAAGDSDALLESLRKVTSDPMYRTELRNRGDLRVTHFSWDRSAEEMATIYRRIRASSS